MAEERIAQQASTGPSFVPPTNTEIPDSRNQACTVTIPGFAGQNVTLKQAVPPNRNADPNLRINGKLEYTVKLNAGASAPFRVLYNYPSTQNARPDVSRSILVQNNGGADIPGAQVTYDFIVRDSLAIVPPGMPEFAVYGGDNASLQLRVVNGEGDAVGAATVRVSCAQGNAQFYDENGTDITQETVQDGSIILYGDYVTNNIPGNPEFGTAKAELSALNTGIFDLSVQVRTFNTSHDFTLVVADDQIVGGELPAPRLSFASTLDLSGLATTFVRLAQRPANMPDDAKVVLVVNGNPVAPYDLTLQQFVTVGYELPKLWFVKKTIDGGDPGGKAALYYMIQSQNDDPNETRSVVKKFTTVGTVVNKPNPNVGPRTLPMPMVSGVTIVNQSVIERNVLPVTIDFTTSGVPAGLSGYLTLYANGYSANTSTSIDDAQTITQAFVTEAGKMVIEVDASLLWGFTESASNQPSTLLMDYYVMSGVPIDAMQGGVPNDIEDPEQREATKAYSKFLANGWILATPVAS